MILTSSPAFLQFVTGSILKVPGLTRWQIRKRVALVAGPTQHLTTRADDSHAAPVCEFEGTSSSLKDSLMSRPGRPSRCIELNHMLHRVCAGPRQFI